MIDWKVDDIGWTGGVAVCEDAGVAAVPITPSDILLYISYFCMAINVIEL